MVFCCESKYYFAGLQSHTSSHGGEKLTEDAEGLDIDTLQYKCGYGPMYIECLKGCERRTASPGASGHPAEGYHLNKGCTPPLIAQFACVLHSCSAGA